MPHNCFDLAIANRNDDFHGCRIQILWRDTKDDVRVSIYLPQEPRQRLDFGVAYFQEHFAKNVNAILTDIANSFNTTVQQVSTWSELQCKGTKRFSVEISCTPEEANIIRAGNWQKVASITDAVERLEAIAEHY